MPTAAAVETTETATPKMGDIYAAVGETVTSHMGDIYAVVETHAVIDDCPLGADAVTEAVAAAVQAISAIVGIVVVVGIAITVAIGIVITALCRAGHGTVWTGVRLRGSR